MKVMDEIVLEHHLEHTALRRPKVILPIAPVILELEHALFGSLFCFVELLPGEVHRLLVDMIALLLPGHEHMDPIVGDLSERLGFDVILWDRRRSTVHSTQINIPRRVVRCLGIVVCVRTAPVLRPGNGEIIHTLDDPLRNVAQGDEVLHPELSSIGLIAVGFEIALHCSLKLRLRSLVGRRSTDTALLLLLSPCCDPVPGLLGDLLPLLRLPPMVVDPGHDLVLEVAGDHGPVVNHDVLDL